jgi:hypothetical protein
MPVMHFLPALDAPALCDAQGPYYASLEASRVTCRACLKHMQPRVSERAFMQAIRRVAVREGWKAYHTYTSKRSEPGFPDLVLIKPPVVLFSEVKRHGAQPTLDQQRWLEALQCCTQVETYLWFPEDMAAITARLQGERPRPGEPARPGPDGT